MCSVKMKKNLVDKEQKILSADTLVLLISKSICACAANFRNLIRLVYNSYINAYSDLFSAINMASVDRSRSLQLASDEVFNYECGPCKSDDKVSEAKHYSQVCNDYLCDDCRGHHKKFKELRNHKIVPVSTVSKYGAGEGSGIPGVKCNCNQNLVEFFCEDHDDVICGPCKTIKHRKCKVSTIQDKAASLKGSKQESVLSKTRSLVGKMEHMQSERQAEKNKVGKAKDDCRAKIETFQRNLNSLLDGMKKDLLKDLGPLGDQHIQSIENQVSTLTSTLPMLRADCKFLEEIERNGTNKAIFAAGIKV